LEGADFGYGFWERRGEGGQMYLFGVRGKIERNIER